MDKEKQIVIFHICDYCASYKGNFISSLQSLDGYKGIKNVYLFPYRSSYTGAKLWIDELNSENKVAYIQHKWTLLNIFLLNRIIRKHKVDFVFRHFYDIKIDFVLKLVFRSRNIIRFMHCMYKDHAAVGIKHKLRCLLWHRNTFIGVSSAVSDFLRLAFPNALIKTIENGIAIDRLNHQKVFENDENKVVLMCMGYNVHVKGVDLALMTTDAVRRQYNVVLYIVAGAHEDMLVAFIEQTFGCVPDWIKILPPTTQIDAYLKSADVFLAPSRTEAFSYTVLEAACCKIPIVASRSDGQGRLDVDGIYWFENEDVEGFRRQLELAISELKDPKMVSMRENVALRTKQRYSLGKWCEEVFKLINGNRVQ